MSKKDKKPNNTEFVKQNSNSKNSSSMNVFLVPLSIILSGVLIMVSVLISATAILDRDELITKSNLNAALATALSQANLTNPTTTADNTTQETFTAAKSTLEDDPTIGDKSKAKVAIIEFSDYECPFCKRHYDQTYAQIKKDYVDTGKVVLTFRDNPLPFHEPAASMKAMAAECVEEIGGTSKYFEYHDKLFTDFDKYSNTILTKSSASAKVSEIVNQYYTARTISGDEARKQILDLKDSRNSQPLKDLAASIGIDKEKVSSCIDDDKYREEVEKDIASASSSGASGTPGFIIGRLDDNGNVDGKLISGAYPFSSFQEVLSEYLD